MLLSLATLLRSWAQKLTSPKKERISNIQHNNTAWVFVAGAAEPRHLDDILFASLVLIQKGIKPEAISVFTDHPFTPIHLKHAAGINIYSLDDLEVHIKKLKQEHLVVAITGHGNFYGIPNTNKDSISPTKFLNIVKSPNSLKTASLIVCQCYAGIFNYLDVRQEPKVCILGATNLHLSLSASATMQQPITSALDGTILNLSWDANIFFARFFAWILRPEDLDGDSETTILDAYRFAGSVSNDELRLVKKSVSTKIDQYREELKNLNPITDPNNLRRNSLIIEIDKLGDLFHLHQEPWILHPDLARKLHVKI